MDDLEIESVVTFCIVPLILKSFHSSLSLQHLVGQTCFLYCTVQYCAGLGVNQHSLAHGNRKLREMAMLDSS